MSESKLEFLLQRKIREEYKITVPDPVQELLFEDPKDTDNMYMWNFDSEDRYIIISNQTFDENQSRTMHASPVYNNHSRTTIPKKVRNEFDLRLGDDLYFVTPKAVTDGTPAVFIWTFEQIEELILEGSGQVESGFPRQPHF